MLASLAALRYGPMTVELLIPSVLDRVPGWRGRPRVTEPLAGGITNRNYRVAVDGEAFVVRVPAESGGLLGIDRRAEGEGGRGQPPRGRRRRGSRGDRLHRAGGRPGDALHRGTAGPRPFGS